MAEQATEMQRRQIFRLSNAEANRMTRECIETALILLMRDHDFKDITITDIVRRSGVSRSAYYRNYTSKEDILNTILETVVKNISRAMNLHALSGNWFEFWRTLFCDVRAISEMYYILLKAGFEGAILNGMNKVLQESNPESSTKERFHNYFWSGAVYNILTEWIRGGMKQSDEEMAKVCMDLQNE